MEPVHQDLARMLRANAFEPYIRYIRFPRFRGLRDGLKLEFLHPVTVLVGPNGTNKTAVLRALQGAPDKESLGQYWFSTSLDPIRAEDRHRFIYGYLAQSVNRVVEVVKTRIMRQGDPDYWEPAEPTVQDGMARMPKILPGRPMPPERSSTRWTALPKKVVYLDFRSELSAYDKFFFHVPYRRGRATLREKKAYIRRRAKHVADSLGARSSHYKYLRSERIIERATPLSQDQVDTISEILGRKYLGITVLRHNFFDVQGATVVINSMGQRYSEAFAGSGEFAVVMLVKAISEATPASLILLDEPEVSLHPGAQRKLMAFISEQAKRNRHQVVISTHSPEILRGLPPQAIKVFQRNETDGKVDLVSQESEPEEAFFRLGVQELDVHTIFVEDSLAAAIVKRAARELGEAANARLKIEVLPGGAGAIQQKFIPTFALSGRERCVVLLDGDQRPTSPCPDPARVVDADLEDTVEEVLKCKPLLSLDGSAGHSSPGQKQAQLRKILAWMSEHLDYLPSAGPEALLLEMEGAPGGQWSDPKQVWLDRARHALGLPSWEAVTSADILAEQKRAVGQIRSDCEEITLIAERVKKFLGE